MPASFHEASGQLEIREGGGALMLFGLPFLAAGIFTILASLGIVPAATTGRASTYARPILGLFFTGVGAAFVFGRKWIVLDAVNRRLVRQWGALVPLRAKVSPLDEYRAVTINFVRGDSDTTDRFPVSLKGTTGADVTLFTPASYAEARAGAVAIAQHLRIDLEDATTDHSTRQPLAELEGSFRNRATRTGGIERTVEQPASMRSTITRDADSLQILIPAPPTNAIAFASAVAPLVIPLIFGPMLARLVAQSRVPDFASRVFLGLFLLGFGVIPAMTCVNAIIRSRRGLTVVVVSRDGLLVRQRGAWLTRTVASIDAAEIVDVDYSTLESAAAKRATVRQTATSGYTVAGEPARPRTERIILSLARFVRSGGITVKTTRGLTTFGAGLEDDEVRYLHSIIRRTLQG